MFSIRKQDSTVRNGGGKILASRNNSDQDQAEIVTIHRGYKRGSIWTFKDGNLVNLFGYCLERVKPKGKEWSGLIQAKCDSNNRWQKFHFA